MAQSEHHVFRTALVSVFLTLAVGPHISQLCRTWCDLQVAATGCHHDGPAASSRVAEDDGCISAPLGIAFLKEDERRSASTPGALNAVAVPRCQLILVWTDHRSDRDTADLHPPDGRPLETSLRI
jgi:hypothetical protein